jgi:hypothetical protein
VSFAKDIEDPRHLVYTRSSACSESKLACRSNEFKKLATIQGCRAEELGLSASAQNFARPAGMVVVPVRHDYGNDIAIHGHTKGSKVFEGNRTLRCGI